MYQPFQYAPESSLRIYEPIAKEITKGFFSSQQQTRQPDPSPQKTYYRQQSLIDQLENRESSSHKNTQQSDYTLPKTTSIELMMDEDRKNNKFSNIQELFANRPQQLSKEISSSVLGRTSNPLFQVHERYSLEESLKNSKSLIQSPPKQPFSDSPERPNLSRPFLRKKPTSKASSLQDSDPKKEENQPFEHNKLDISIKTLKDYNNDLMTVLQTLEDQRDWRQLKAKQLQLLKLMIEKAIISKEVR